MNRRTITLLVGVVILLVASVALTLNYYAQTHGSTTTTKYDDEWTGYQIVAGNNSATDGRLEITLNNYYFENGFAYVNATFQNVGNGDAFYQPAVLEIANGLNTYSNGELFLNETFSNEFPNMTVPDYTHYGGFNLAPGSSSTYCVVFSFQFVPNMGNGSGYAVKQFMAFERGYGGTYEGQNAYACPCENTMVEFIILPNNP